MIATEVKTATTTLETSLATITKSLDAALDDIADLKQDNAQLAEEIATLKKARQPTIVNVALNCAPPDMMACSTNHDHKPTC